PRPLSPTRRGEKETHDLLSPAGREGDCTLLTTRGRGTTVGRPAHLLARDLRAGTISTFWESPSGRTSHDYRTPCSAARRRGIPARAQAGRRRQPFHAVLLVARLGGGLRHGDHYCLHLSRGDGHGAVHGDPGRKGERFG